MFDIGGNKLLSTALMHWDYIAPLLTPPSTEEEYQVLVESLDALLDSGTADEAHPLAGMVGDLISAYEQKHYPMPTEMSGVEALCFLWSAITCVNKIYQRLAIKPRYRRCYLAAALLIYAKKKPYQ